MTAAQASPDAAPDRADLRLVLPATATWLVAWQGRLLAPAAVVVLACGLLALGAVTLWRSRRPTAATIAAVCLCAAAAGLATAARTHARTTSPLAVLAESKAAVSVSGVVTDDPRLSARHAPGRQPVVVVRLRVERLRSGGRTVSLRSPLLLLTSDNGWLSLLPSQRVEAQGRLLPAGRGDDVAALLSGRGHPVVRGPPSRLQRIAGRLRAGLRKAVSPLPPHERGLLPGLVVGDTSALAADVRDDFRTVGLTHLTAVSGSNVAIILAAVLALSRRAGAGLRVAPFLAGVGLLGFVVLARPSPSVVRAAAMGVVGLAALATGNRRRAVPSLCAAVLVLVLVAPDLAASPGFALSVLATGGLLVFAPPWRAALARRLPGWLADALAVPAAAQLACGPVIVALSGNLGLLSVPANLLAIPAVAPATVLGVGAALLAPVSMPLAQLAAWLAYLPTAWLVLLSHVGADMPGAAVPWPAGARGALLLAGLTAAAYPVLRRRVLRRVLLAAALGVSMTGAALRVTAPGWPPKGWVLVMCDVGQGDALVVRTGPAAAVVVDSGPDPKAVDSCLRGLGIRRVPLVVLTHLHADHVDGLPGILAGRAVGAVEVGPVDDPALKALDVTREAAAARVPLVRVMLGESRHVGAVSWTVLAPSRAYHGTRSDPNNDSIVLRLEVGGVVVLLTGDVEPEAQRDLVASGQDLRADVLKVPHHGSDHQEPAFLAAVGARVTLTSVGAGNTYGHPSAATLGRLMGQGARSYRTDRDGEVAVVAAGGAVRVVGRHGTGSIAPAP